MTARRDAIRSIYAEVGAPDWAAANLDALADVLRDLSWLPPGPLRLSWSPATDLPAAERSAIEAVIRHAVRETADGPRPVHWR
jgi:Barstar (barnase inhibitor)